MSKSPDSSEPLLDIKQRSPGWLDFATVSSVALGLAEAFIGRIGNSNALLANAVESLDNLTYGLDSLAARDELARRKNHMLRRFAGSIICAASLYVAANSAYDLVSREVPEINSDFAALSGAAAILDGAYVLGLHKYAQRGTTHRDAFRHAVADTTSSVIATGALIASTHGYPAVDAWVGLGLSGWTILMTFPTNRRITSADKIFVRDKPIADSDTAQEYTGEA